MLFLREGDLWAYEVDSGNEQLLVDDVRFFSVTPDGGRLALLRGAGAQTEIWLADRDGRGLSRLTNNDRAEERVDWAPDGLSLVYASADTDQAYELDWLSWSRWCAESEVRLIDIPDGRETTLAEGCDPAFSTDGRRIAFATPPGSSEPGLGADGPLVLNSIRLINRQGENGWDLAMAAGVDAPAPDTGRDLYAPAWSPTSEQVVYHRFLGYQALVDITVSEIAGSYTGDGRLLADGAGWLLPARFSPDGTLVSISEHNYSDARGFGGYDDWSVTLIRLQGSREVVLPNGALEAVGQQLDRLPRAQTTAWSPAGDRLVVLLPPNWQPGMPNDQPLGVDPGTPGELWLWRPGTLPEQRLIDQVDYASPLAWLPPAPAAEAGARGYQLVYPAGWELAEPSEFEERTAAGPDERSLMTATRIQVGDPATASVEDLFSFFVADVTAPGDLVEWPDQSFYRPFEGTTPEGREIAGAMRIVPQPGADAVVALYITQRTRWPYERARAQALLARCSPAALAGS